MLSKLLSIRLTIGLMTGCLILSSIPSDTSAVSDGTKRLIINASVCFLALAVNIATKIPEVKANQKIERVKQSSKPFRTTMEFEESFPDQPIPFSGLTNIHQMDEKLWKPEDLIQDFELNRRESEEAIMVVVKTEYCSDNSYRACAVTTAVLETVPIEVLKKFRIYMAWVKHPEALHDYPGMNKNEKKEWDKQVIAEYNFKQGPGASIVLISPSIKKPYRVKTDARLQALNRSKIGFDQLQTFEKTLNNFLTEMTNK